MTPPDPPLRVAVEATSVLGPRTGIGAMTAALLERFGPDPTLDVTGVTISWRGRRDAAEALPPGVRPRFQPFPANLAMRLWMRGVGPRLRGFDLVHGPNYVVPPSPGAVELLSLHDFGPWHFPELVHEHARRYPRLVDQALDRGAHIHVDSDFVGAEARDILGVPPERVHTVRLGFDGPQGPSGASETPDDGSRGRSVAGHDRYVLAVGTIEPRKDLPTLVAAMAQVEAADPTLRLVVAGGDGWGTEAFEAALATHGLTERVIRLGYVSDRDRVDLVAGARCLAFPSIYEGFGLPPLEAMALGTPVVTTTAGSLPEVCGDGARFVAPGAPAELAAAILAVDADDDQRRTLIAAGRRNIERFSWDAMAADMADLYRRLVAGP
ncbi:MAG: glycosyltransferase family 1 protein [Actinomycetota bacterium]